jgi:hypothetical protein
VKSSLQAALDARDAVALAELRSDLAKLGPDAQELAALIASESELSEADVRERLGRRFEGACRELDALLRALA